MSNGLTRREFVKAAGQAVAATSAMGLTPSLAQAQGRFNGKDLSGASHVALKLRTTRTILQDT
jgi:hypothetical protein